MTHSNHTETRFNWPDLMNPAEPLAPAERRQAGRLLRIVEDAAGESLADLLTVAIDPATEPGKELVFWLEFTAWKLLSTAAIIARKERDEVLFLRHQRLMDDARNLAGADAAECPPGWID